ncbi:MAG TPA: flagellar biosynthesis protein FliQ [Gammaproteobacteria bacterium]|nr:flagellar biosynthesis protein FliQ [Gammaproteobacteria bacterium]
MTPETVMTIGQDALMLTVMLCAPMLGAALAIGLLVGMFQAATSINEMTLSFIPKLLVLVVVIFATGHWMLASLMSYTQRLIMDIPQVIG